MPQRADTPTEKTPHNEVQLEVVRQAIESLRYGAVTVVVQDGRIVQIEKTEKIRV